MARRGTFQAQKEIKEKTDVRPASNKNNNQTVQSIFKTHKTGPFGRGGGWLICTRNSLDRIYIGCLHYFLHASRTTRELSWFLAAYAYAYHYVPRVVRAYWSSGKRHHSSTGPRLLPRGGDDAKVLRLAGLVLLRCSGLEGLAGVLVYLHFPR